MSELVEWIRHGEEVLGLVIRAATRPSKTEFLTPNHFHQQLGFVVHPAGKDVVPHLHRPMKRDFAGTTEVLFLRSGRVRMDFYGRDKTLVTSRDVNAGDVVALISGGHGLHFYEDSVFVEVKQGPYVGPEEKEPFTPGS